MVIKKQKRRGVVTRQPKQIIVIGAEGHNQTEQLYFRNFNRIQRRYVVKFSSGNSTDPLRMVKDVNSWVERQKGIELAEGKDYAFVIFDTDTDVKKESEIQRARGFANKSKIYLIWSNPCFEVWYILHFVYSTAPFSSSDEVLRSLCKHIPGYQKNIDVFDRIYKYTQNAVAHAKKLRRYHQENEHAHLMERNPGSEVDVLVELLTKEI